MLRIQPDLRLLALTLVLQFASAGNADTNDSSDRSEPSLLQRITSAFPKQPMTFDENPEIFRSLANAIVRDNLPDEYVDDRKWGLKKEIYSGLSVRRDGLKIRTKRKRKKVNHGTWKLYRINQIDPEDNIVFDISEPIKNDRGNVDFRIDLTAKVHTYARVSEWNRGVRLASISADAEAKVRLLLWIELGVSLDPTKLPPDVILKPRVTDADIQIQQFRVHRISKIDGKIARELGRGLRTVLKKKVDEKKPKLVAKINKKIDENQDDLRLSVSDFVSKKWKSLTEGKEQKVTE